jgi:predicted AAA+ superfamily ATPase
MSRIHGRNTALMTALAHTSFSSVQTARDHWGRLVESAVGAHLLNSSLGTDIQVQYWLDRNREVDFVLFAGDALTVIEVKSGVRDTRLPGIAAFAGAFPVTRQLLVGAQGIPLAEFLSHPATHWFE